MPTVLARVLHPATESMTLRSHEQCGNDMAAVQHRGGPVADQDGGNRHRRDRGCDRGRAAGAGCRRQARRASHRSWPGLLLPHAPGRCGIRVQRRSPCDPVSDGDAAVPSGLCRDGASSRAHRLAAAGDLRLERGRDGVPGNSRRAVGGHRPVRPGHAARMAGGARLRPVNACAPRRREPPVAFAARVSAERGCRRPSPGCRRTGRSRTRSTARPRP